FRLQDLRRGGVQQRRAEWAPAFAIFDLGVDEVGGAFDAGVADNAAIAERPGAKLHAALEPRNDLAFREEIAGDAGDRRDLIIADTAGLERGFDLLVGVFRPQVRVLHRFDRVAKLMRGVRRGTERRAGV